MTTRRRSDTFAVQFSEKHQNCVGAAPCVSRRSQTMFVRWPIRLKGRIRAMQHVPSGPTNCLLSFTAFEDLKPSRSNCIVALNKVQPGQKTSPWCKRKSRNLFKIVQVWIALKIFLYGLEWPKRWTQGVAGMLGKPRFIPGREVNV